jgi:excisionase family DNA binding protein
MDTPIDPAATYAIEEVAALKGVSYAHVRTAIVRGELPATRKGTTWTIRGADAVAWNPRH